MDVRQEWKHWEDTNIYLEELRVSLGKSVLFSDSFCSVFVEDLELLWSWYNKQEDKYFGKKYVNVD